MPDYFSGKTILITGASSGIGKALAEAMAGNNVKLILTARRMDELKSLSVLCNSKGAACFNYFLDAGDSNSIEQFSVSVKSNFNKIDILINNAGISQRSLAEETILQVDRKMMEINFFGPVHLTKALFPLLLKSDNAQVILMSSLTGTFGYPLRSAYAASKHAIEGFFESWRLENKHSNVSFTIIAPGRIFTNISYAALTKDGSPHQLLDEGQAKGIKVEVCAQKIVKAIKNKKRKIYIIQNEWVLLFLYKYIHPLFDYLIKKLNLK